MEDPQRLCVGEKHADKRQTAGAYGFGYFAAGAADGKRCDREERHGGEKKEGFQSQHFRMSW
jgi:hypothetical protein